MKRIAILAVAARLAMVILVAADRAQETTMMETTMMQGGQTMMETTMMQDGQTMMMEETTMVDGRPLPQSGGPAVLLPAAALLLGSGVLAFAVLRRR